MLRHAVLAFRRWSQAQIARVSGLPRLDVLAIMKNESQNIEEWVEHYRWMGANRICLIDNGSTDDTLKKARRLEAQGKVKLIRLWRQHRQRQHIWTAYEKFEIARWSDWLLIADLDEFWFSLNGDPLPRVLATMPEVDLIYCNWTQFGSSGLIGQPPSVREGFTLRRPGKDRHTKYIIRTAAVSAANELHIHRVRSPVKLRTVANPPMLQLNHYQIQSLEFFQNVKMTRGDVSGKGKDTMRDMDYFHRQDEGCAESDRKLADLVAARRKS
jgi:Glycosyl transferase family 2